MIRNMVPVNPALTTAAIGHDAYQQYCGWLISSRSWTLSRLPDAPVWAADNDCFSDWNPVRFTRFLKRIQGIPNCKFVNAPDVVCDHAATLARFAEWHPVIKAHDLPVGFVLQNGVTLDTVPWDSIDALFIGGDTRFKFTHTVQEIVREGKRRGLWVHNGRVNSGRRITYSIHIGCDSFDGTSYKYSVNIKHDLQYMQTIQRGLPCF